MLNRDFKEFVALLNQHEVKYLIVGGYALAVHGHPRYTKDLDVWISADTGNAGNMINALRDFGFSTLDISEQDLLTPGVVVQLGYPPSRIDILTRAAGVDFDTCYAAKTVLEINGVTVNFIDVANLIKNKKAVGRLQDLADVEFLNGL